MAGLKVSQLLVGRRIQRALIATKNGFEDIEVFKASTTKLAEDILAVEPINPNEPVRVPGYRGAERRASFLESGYIEIEDADWQKFTTAYEKLKP